MNKSCYVGCQLGNGLDSNCSVPVVVSDLPPIAFASIGGGHNLVVDFKGNIWSWGLNDEGQLGIGVLFDSNRPQKVHNLNGRKAISVSAGWCHSIAAFENGDVCFPKGTLVADSHGIGIPIQKANRILNTLPPGEYFGTDIDLVSNSLSERTCRVLPQGHKPVIQLSFEDGTIIRCTDNHRFHTPDGFVAARDLRVNYFVSCTAPLVRNHDDNDQMNLWLRIPDGGGLILHNIADDNQRSRKSLGGGFNVTAMTPDGILAFARLAGAIHGNGVLSKSGEGVLHLETKIDVAAVDSDFKLLGLALGVTVCKPMQYSPYPGTIVRGYQILVPASIGRVILGLGFPNKSANWIRMFQIPSIVLQAPLVFQREFLAALHGSRGGQLTGRGGPNAEEGFMMKSIVFSHRVQKKKIPSLLVFQQYDRQLRRLYENQGVSLDVTFSTMKEWESSNFLIYQSEILSNPQNLRDFVVNVGVRYSSSKRAAFAIYRGALGAAAFSNDMIGPDFKLLPDFTNNFGLDNSLLDEKQLGLLRIVDIDWRAKEVEEVFDLFVREGHHFLPEGVVAHNCTFGRNLDGELGLGDTLSRSRPNQVSELNGLNVVCVSAGNMTGAVTESGRVYTWGLGSNGELGHGTRGTLLYPKLVAGLLGVRILCLSVGIDSMLAISDHGELYSWGLGNCFPRDTLVADAHGIGVEIGKATRVLTTLKPGVHIDQDVEIVENSLSNRPSVVVKQSNLRELLKITFQDGTLLRCTRNHPFYWSSHAKEDEEHFVNAENLVVGDYVRCTAPLVTGNNTFEICDDELEYKYARIFKLLLLDEEENFSPSARTSAGMLALSRLAGRAVCIIGRSKPAFEFESESDVDEMIADYRILLHRRLIPFEIFKNEKRNCFVVNIPPCFIKMLRSLGMCTNPNNHHNHHNKRSLDAYTIPFFISEAPLVMQREYLSSLHGCIGGILRMNTSTNTNGGGGEGFSYSMDGIVFEMNHSDPVMPYEMRAVGNRYAKSLERMYVSLGVEMEKTKVSTFISSGDRALKLHTTRFRTILKPNAKNIMSFALNIGVRYSVLMRSAMAVHRGALGYLSCICSNVNSTVDRNMLSEINNSTSLHGKLKILSIELSTEPEEVFDLQVREGHHFLAEGIVVHNSGRLGHGDNETRLVPTKVKFFEGKRMRVIGTPILFDNLHNSHDYDGRSS